MGVFLAPFWTPKMEPEADQKVDTPWPSWPNFTAQRLIWGRFGVDFPSIFETIFETKFVENSVQEIVVFWGVLENVFNS